MNRLWWFVAAFFLTPLAHSLAGTITHLDVKALGKEAVVSIRGDYGSYRATGERSPARLILEFYDTGLGPRIPSKIPIPGTVAKEVKTATWKAGVRVAIYSRDPSSLFKYNIEESQEELIIRCREGGQGKDLGIPRGSPPGLFSGERITMDFYKTDIHNVMRLFAEISGRNMVLDERVKGEVTISLKDVPWDQALDLILEANDLVKEEKDGVVVIRPVGREGPKEEGVLTVKRLSPKGMVNYRAYSMEKALEAKVASLLYQARSFEEGGSSAKALDLYEKAYVLLKPYPDWHRTNPWLISRLAELSIAQGAMEKAYHYAKELLVLRGDDAWAFHVAAISCHMLGKDAEAKMYFQLALGAERASPELLLNYATFLEDTSDPGSAIEIYEKYEQLYGPDPKVLLDMARLYEELGQRTRACEKYREVLRSRPQGDLERGLREKFQTLCGNGGAR